MIHVLHFVHSPLPPMTVKTGTVSKCINLSDLMTVVSRSVTARILVSLHSLSLATGGRSPSKYREPMSRKSLLVEGLC